jgi:hypothetical protein
MPQAAAHSWWAEVEHLREPLERRRREADPGPGRGPVGAVSAEDDRSALGPRIITSRGEPSARRAAEREQPAAPVAVASADAPRQGRGAERARRSSHVDGPARSGRFRRREHEDAYVQAARQPPRRTVQIRGQAIPNIAAPRLVEVERRRPLRGVTPATVQGNPDRIALWAFLLGALLVVVAILTAHAG